MIIFEKTPDPRHEGDVATVRFTMSNESGLMEVFEAFVDFLRAVGYHGVEEFFDGEEI